MKQLLIIIIFFFLGCLKQNGPVIKNDIILFYPTTDSAYDLELLDDTLYVANGMSGLKILKINIENPQPLDSLFEGNLVSGVERFVDVIVSENYLFLLEKLEFTNATTYILNQNFPIIPDNYANLNCYRYQSKVVFSGVTEFSDDEELIIVRKHINQYDELDRFSSLFIAPFAPAIGWVDKKDCVNIELNKYNADGVNLLNDQCELCPEGIALDCNDICAGDAILDGCGHCVGGNTGLLPCPEDCNRDEGGIATMDECGVCSGGNTGLMPCSIPVDCNDVENGNSYLNNCGDCISVLSYNLSDIEYYKRNDGDYLYLTNSNEKFSSVQLFIRTSQGSFDFYKEDTLSSKPLTIKVYEHSYIVGLDYNKGAYIVLLDLESPLPSKLSIANGYTIQDIRFNESSNLLILSAGYGGVLVYDWDGESMPTPRAMISSGYAYSALVFDHNKIIVGTKNGIEIYEI